jgi:surface protein
MAIIITNVNLRELVESYIFDKSKLPEDLIGSSIGDWDVSNVTDMHDLFDFTDLDDDDELEVFQSFNFESLDGWDVSNVTDMSGMFRGCSNFNEPLNGWDVSEVTNMSGMFRGCRIFNQPLDRWVVSKVTNMYEMFRDCRFFNKPLNRLDVSWDVSNVTNMANMFRGCSRFNQPLTDWDVSKVTNMYDMFKDCRIFNQPLNGWDVSNVKDMASMFRNCSRFNQPLDRWVVSNVRNMYEMFRNCRNFNQPLINWNVTSVENADKIFEGCGISEENKPTVNRQIVVDELQVHKEAAKINYAKLNAFLKEKLDNVAIPEDINYSAFINAKISTLINESGDTEETKVQQRNDLERIVSERLRGLNYQERSMLIRESIFYTLNYVLKQPNAFKQLYLQTFIQDCIHAYEGEDGMTCANGALERIVFSLVPACATEETNADYETIKAIITANPSVLIPIYIRDWYKLHKIGTDNAFPEGTTEEDMKSNLKSYLLEKLPNETVLIDKKIVEYADAIGYDEDSFTYGGKKTKKAKNKKTKKTKKIKKIKKTKKINKKIKTKKTRKTKK